METVTSGTLTITNATSIGAWVENEGESFTVTSGTNPRTGLANSMVFTNKVPFNPTFMGAQQLTDIVFSNITGTLKIVYFN